MRMLYRNIGKDELMELIQHGEVIENYPDDFPYPSKLIFKMVNGRALRTVVAWSSENLTAIIVTCTKQTPNISKLILKPAKRNKMECVTCKHGNTAPGKTVVTFVQNETTVVIKDVPAEICDLCGAYYLSPDAVEEVRKIVNQEKGLGNEISVVKMKTAA